MTYREKLAKEQPEMIDDCEWGGCLGCPSSYGYERHQGCRDGNEEACTACWDREIPEEKPADKPATHAVPSGRGEARDAYIDPVHITIHTNLIDDPTNVIAEVFKYVYTIKDRVVNISIQ